MTKFIGILAFILIIGLVIFIHEFGHFFLAKRNGVQVLRFAVGIGPTLFSKKKNGTEYAINLIPFGGYCLLAGDEAIALLSETEKTEDEREDRGEDEESVPAFTVERDRYFSERPVFARIAIIAAGPLFNFLLALLLAILLVSMIGASTAKLVGVSEGTPAEAAGLREGDTIVKLNDTRIYLFEDLTMFFSFHEGEPVTVTYERDGERFSAEMVPVYDEEYERYMIGIYGGGRETDLGFFRTVKYGFHEFRYNCSLVIKSLGLLLRGKASVNDLSGPVGMAGLITDLVTEVSEDTKEEPLSEQIYWIFINLLNFTVLISANLGVMNLLPIPAMDGGRLLFLLAEAVCRKPINKKAERIITAVGMGFLVLLMIFVFFNDIRKVFFF